MRRIKLYEDIDDRCLQIHRYSWLKSLAKDEWFETGARNESNQGQCISIQ